MPPAPAHELSPEATAPMPNAKPSASASTRYAASQSTPSISVAIARLVQSARSPSPGSGNGSLQPPGGVWSSRHSTSPAEGTRSGISPGWTGAGSPVEYAPPNGMRGAMWEDGSSPGCDA